MSEPAFAISQVTTLAQPFDDDLATYSHGGAGGIGIWEFKLPERDDAEVLERVRASGLRVTNCVPTVPSILPLPRIEGPPDAAERVDAYCTSLRRLAAFEPDCLVLLTGSAAGFPDARGRVVEALRRIAAEAARAGVRVALEPVQREGGDDWTIVSTLGEAAALLAEADVPSIGLVFDTWHLWNTPYETELERHAARVAGVHVADWREPTRGWADRVLPGDGIADVPRMLAALERAGWRGAYDLEIFSDNGAFGDAYPDSLWDVPAPDLVARGRQAFLACWERRA